MNSLASYVDATLAIEKLRVASQVRQTHLLKRNNPDENTDKIIKKLTEAEDFINEIIADNLESHPAYWWFSKVKGIGKENIGKVIGFVRIKPEMGIDEDGNEYSLPYADNISSLWRFAGYMAIDGEIQKRVKGEKLDYCSQLRSMCWRLANSLLRARGKFYDYYLNEKNRYEQKYINQGYKIISATKLPTENGKKVEKNDLISEGHIHNLALRRMIKLFLSCLFLAWRKGEGLPETKPYVIEKLGHNSFVSPEEMMDK